MLSDKEVEEVLRILSDAMPGRTRNAKGPKGQPDAFRSCISCMLSAQSLDRNTAKAIRALFALATTPEEMLELDDRDIAEQADAEAHLFDWAGGLLWLRTASGTDLRAKLGTYDGHATLIRADATTKERLGDFQPETAGVARLTAGLRARFDPKGLFNAGLMETAA